ncbi:hypothetical protein HNP48_002002 [Acidovorax soli]|uniref:Uncharacterized protein n=1 Tax=Acidovorax soli TaxID=592050 RepID=A0A7X0U9A5_9BURK|nr:hypothetical protein [Acidovorax soli]MBB6559335.1 hypothetical protein [Acidovorax soli]
MAREPRADGVRVKPEGQAAMLAAHFDNGFFSKVDGGQMANKPMDENSGATSGVHALKFLKTCWASSSRSWHWRPCLSMVANCVSHNCVSGGRPAVK